MEINITILKGIRPPPQMTLTTPDSLDSSIEAAIPEDLKPGYVSKCLMWGLVWIVRDARGSVRVERTHKKKKKKS